MKKNRKKWKLFWKRRSWKRKKKKREKFTSRNSVHSPQDRRRHLLLEREKKLSIWNAHILKTTTERWEEACTVKQLSWDFRSSSLLTFLFFILWLCTKKSYLCFSSFFTYTIIYVSYKVQSFISILLTERNMCSLSVYGLLKISFISRFKHITQILYNVWWIYDAYVDVVFVIIIIILE